MKAKPTPKKMLKALAKLMGVSVESILSHCRKAELVDSRSMIAAILMSRMHLRQQDVAAVLDVSQAAVSKLMARHRLMMSHPGGDPDYQKRYADFVRQVPPLHDGEGQG